MILPTARPILSNRQLDEIMKINYIRQNITNYADINPIADTRAVDEIRDKMVADGLFKINRKDLYTSVINLILKAQGKYIRRKVARRQLASELKRV